MTDPIFRFGLLADVQYADDETNVDLDRHYRDSPAKLREAIDDLNSQDLAMIIHLGDLVDHDLTNAPTVLEIMDTATAPVHQVLGNHDFGSTSSPNGRNPVDAVLGAYEMAARYYRIDQPGWRFLVLDTNEVGVIEHPPGTPGAAAGEALLARLRQDGRPNANPWNGTLGPDQRDWLADQLRQAAEAGQRAAVFAHHPVFGDHPDNGLDDHELLDWLTGFEALTVWFNGHQHAGGYGSHRGVHFLTLHGVVQSVTNAYAVAEVYADRIMIVGRGRQPSYQLMIN